jgi:hypothetical protein
MAKLDSVLQEGLLVDRRWLVQHGIDGTAVDYYLRAGKIEAVVHGIYRKPGPPLKWQNVMYSLTQLNQNVHVGHMTALAYHGYDHFLKLGTPQSIRLYSTGELPSWVGKVKIGPSFIIMRRNPFSDNEVGVIKVPFGTWDWPIHYSSPERAFIELMSTIRTGEEILQAKLMMEGAASLRPSLLQALLEACCSIKSKRLFLWLSRIAGHSWYNHIDTSLVDLGSGKRQIVPDGMFDTEFMITVPKEIQGGQEEPLF